MKKILSLLSVISILTVSNAAFAAIGYVDYGYISKNYPLAQKYSQTLKNKSQSIRTYAKQKDNQVAKAKTAAEKEKIRKEGISQVQLKQKEYSSLRTRYENELNSKVQAAAEKVRVQKKLDAIIKAAENICKSVGKPDLPIYAGPYRHKVDLSGNEFKEHKLKILGSTDGEDTYLDFKGTTPVAPNIIFNAELYKLK